MVCGVRAPPSAVPVDVVSWGLQVGESGVLPVHARCKERHSSALVLGMGSSDPLQLVLVSEEGRGEQ